MSAFAALRLLRGLLAHKGHAAAEHHAQLHAAGGAMLVGWVRCMRAAAVGRRRAAAAVGHGRAAYCKRHLLGR